MEDMPDPSDEVHGAARAAVSLDDLLSGFEVVSSGGYGSGAYVCKATGKVHVVSRDFGSDEDVPPDVEESDEYVPVPGKRDLRLGRDLAVAFVAEHLPHELDEANDCFRRRGAYARFKSLLIRRGRLDVWHRFEEDATVLALRDWCEENGFDLSMPTP
jgi:hypothetical protein